MLLALSDDFPAERVTDDLIERRMYSRDLAPVPPILTKPFFHTLPDAVVRPADTSQVAEVLREARRQRVPVTPRAAASTSYYNTVPLRGGIVLDVNGLRDGIDLDTARQTVHVGPATTWWELDRALGRRGFAAKSYPSSAISATVGGWVSMEGMGLGSLQYGALGDLLVSLRVVMPDGEIVTVNRTSDPPLDWFVAAEGTLGVITEVELSVRPMPAMTSHHLFAVDGDEALAQNVRALASGEPRPFTVFFADASYLKLLARAGFETPLGSVEEGAPGQDQHVLLVSFQDEAAAVKQGEALLAKLAGRELPSDLALEEWNLRCYHLRTKRAGPSLLAAEQWLPLSGLSQYLAAVKKLSRRSRVVIGTYGLAIAPNQALVMSLYPADEHDQIAYLAAIGFTKSLHDLGACCGGRPYGVGLWNSAYLPRLFSKAQLAEMRRRKARLDPAGIMNPGKLYHTPFPLWPATFAPGAAVLGALFSAMHRGQS